MLFTFKRAKNNCFGCSNWPSLTICICILHGLQAEPFGWSLKLSNLGPVEFRMGDHQNFVFMVTFEKKSQMVTHPSRHSPDFHRPQSIDSPDFHLRRSQKCLLAWDPKTDQARHGRKPASASWSRLFKGQGFGFGVLDFWQPGFGFGFEIFKGFGFVAYQSFDFATNFWLIPKRNASSHGAFLCRWVYYK